MVNAVSRKPRTVLCVDDDDQIRPLLGLILRKAGFTVTEAKSCAEANRALGAETPAFVVLDIDLPDGNGFDMAEAWHNDGHSTLPILFISGREPDKCQTRAAQLKSAFLAKPFHLPDLPSAIFFVITAMQSQI
jgi:two-component system OmpR family response regulator